MEEEEKRSWRKRGRRESGEVGRRGMKEEERDEEEGDG